MFKNLKIWCYLTHRGGKKSVAMRELWILSHLRGNRVNNFVGRNWDRSLTTQIQCSNQKSFKEQNRTKQTFQNHKGRYQNPNKRNEADSRYKIFCGGGWEDGETMEILWASALSRHSNAGLVMLTARKKSQVRRICKYEPPPEAKWETQPAPHGVWRNMVRGFPWKRLAGRTAPQLLLLLSGLERSHVNSIRSKFQVCFSLGLIPSWFQHSAN